MAKEKELDIDKVVSGLAKPAAKIRQVSDKSLKKQYKKLKRDLVGAIGSEMANNILKNYPYEKFKEDQLCKIEKSPFWSVLKMFRRKCPNCGHEF